MPAPSWKGYLKISLVTVPLRAYSASSGSSGPAISLNQLHSTCHSRIQYRKTCPIRGEVSKEEIVSGYEYAKGQYAVIEPEEIDVLRTESDKAISVDTFVPAEAIDPVYLSGTGYYLVPDGPVGQRPYALIRDALADENRVAIGRVVVSSRERLVMVRPVGDLLSMSVLQYASQMRSPSVVSDELVETKPSEEELELTRQLVHGLTREDLELAEYRDEYTDKMREIIDAKVAGQEVVSPPAAAEEPQVVNLMEALKASVQRIEKPEKKMATSARSRAKAAPRKRKSG